jgi:hypothetical protein
MSAADPRQWIRHEFDQPVGGGLDNGGLDGDGHSGVAMNPLAKMRNYRDGSGWASSVE